MNEYLLRAYLQNRRSPEDEEFIRRMRDFYNSEKYARGRGMRRDSRYDGLEDRMYDDYFINRHSKSQLMDMMEDLDDSDKDLLFKMMIENETSEGHFNESYAKYLVSKMSHSCSGRKYVGEKYDMTKAKEVCEKYRGIIPQSATVADVYVALNSQYHDYCELFKAWFGDNIDTKIVESAVNFWFKDDDYKGGNKVYKYYKEA